MDAGAGAGAGAEQPWDPFEGWSKAERNSPIGVTEMADALRVRRDTFYVWVRTGRVPATRLGDRWKCIPAVVVADITRTRGMWARGSTSMVYRALQNKLRGRRFHSTEVPQAREKLVRRHTPAGLLEDVDAQPRQTPISNERIVVDVRGLAEVLDCSPSLVRKMASEGTIPSFRVGSRLRFEVERVLQDLHKRANQARENVDPWINPRSRSRPRGQGWDPRV